MASPMKLIFIAISILAAGPLGSIATAQQPPQKAVQLLGLTGVKDNTKGSLSVASGALRFTHSKSDTDLLAGSVQDVVTGSDSQRMVRGTLGTLSMFGPYGSGRFLSLFRSKLDTLTIKYRDVDGGLHGVIFTMPVNSADVTKGELVAAGARTSIPKDMTPSERMSSAPEPKDPAAAPPAPEGKRARLSASAITVMMVQSDEIKLPAEFQVALFEHLVGQLSKKSGIRGVYREGDRTSPKAPNAVILHSTVRGFKQGSEMARQVTTVAGATSISVHCEFTDPDGKLLLARDIKGNVRFFGGNLNATNDFAKKAANLVRQNFAPATGS